KVISLGIGEPNFHTPKEIIETAYQAMLDGKTGYTPAKGIAPLLSKIAEVHTMETGVDINPKENVIVTPGAKAALFEGLFSILNPGENIVVISPYWPSYVGITKVIGAEVKTVHAHYGDFEFPFETIKDGIDHYGDFEFPFETIKDGIDNKTKALLINSPSNPTGAVYELDALKFIRDISIDNNILIISDEIYKKITFDAKYEQFLKVSQSLENSLIIDGFSKSHAMTGWRIGYAIGHKDIIACMSKMQQNISTCVNQPTQWAGIKALELEEPTIKMVKEYRQRRDKACDLIEKLDYLSCLKPEGAFYLFMKYEGNISSQELAIKILEEKQVALTAGSVFGVEEQYLRLSLASDEESILEGIRRTNDLLSNL
ncbi:MAG: aminotransferase class I/II-fold pyridoxal phosphate-dependent enzyme, partial [Candidatus Heimdallarchaeota archaeon]